MAQISSCIRKTPFALLVVLLWLITPNLAVHAADSDQPSRPTTVCIIHPPVGWQPYRVHPNETLDSIAQQHNVTVEQLRQVNCLSAATIRPNLLLLVPSASATNNAPFTSTVTPNPTLAATPTAPPAPTQPPTVTPTPRRAAASATPPVKPSLTATMPPTLASTPPVTGQGRTNGQGQPPPTSRTTDGVPASPEIDAAPQAADQLWFMVALLLITITLIGYFTLGEAIPAQVATNHRLFSFSGYALLLLIALLVGLFATALFEPASPSTLLTFAGGVGTVLLLGLLILKEVASPWMEQRRALRRLLSLVLIPLLAIFLITVVSRLATVLR
ncbi:MAG: LysM domain-containing protein [Caldilineaceae bacterium]